MTAPSADPSIEEIRTALRENDAEPEGRVRNARAEKLLAEAEATGDRPLLIDALFNLVSAYNFSSESDKSFVPFARLLRMWDERPGDFGEWATHHLHWIFKWVSSGMVDQPHIPLESIERWQSEMEHRYRVAGHSERAVRQGDFTIARHIGDTDRAERAYAAWLAADRDEMSDCHACELHQQGSWRQERGDDEEALRLWRPVLDRTHTCLHEPHGVLASSLLPLVRLGRLEEARSHHVRGYRMVRNLESMRDAVAEHLAFCARTGNEPRGLEILAEQPGHWDPSGDPDTYLDWTVSAALLTRRLVDLGHARQPVPGPPGREWTAESLHAYASDEALSVAARFDKRNGTTVVSDEARARMAGQPLVERLPLGVRGAALGAGPVASGHVPSTGSDEGAPGDGRGDGTEASGTRTPADAAPATAAAADDPRALLAEARRLSGAGHPSALDAWRRLERRVADDGAADGGAPLSPVERAELLDHRAMELARTDPSEGAARFQEAADVFAAEGEEGHALACRARAALATAFAGRPDEALDLLEPLCAEALAAHSDGRASTQHATAVLLSRARIRGGLLGEAEDPHRAAAELDAELAGLIALAEPDRAEPAVLARIADATESRGRLAGQTGDARGAAGLFAEAAALYHSAGRPWQATGSELALAQALLGLAEADEAEGVLRGALDDVERAALLAPEETARVHLALADVLAFQDRAGEESLHLLEAAHWADAAGDSAGLGGHARLRLGGTYLALDRWEEAATVLEAVLPDLLAEHAEGDVVQARWWLGQAHSRMGESREAAEQFLLAADTAKEWEDQRDHAMLAHLAADALKNADLRAEATRAYERAEELWRPLGETYAVVRSLRSRAWIALGDDGDVETTAVTKAIELMAQALGEVERGLQSEQDQRARTRLQLELGQTYRQTAELLLQTTEGPPDEDGDTPEQYAMNLAAYREAVVYTDHAIAVFRSCGETGLADRTGAELMAAWLETDLGRVEAAASRARDVLDAYPERPAADGTRDTDGDGGGDPTPAARRREARAVLSHARVEGEGA
ncbi:tetratricopeptide repeat protein [Streptomyces sp. NPDC054796]